MKKVTIYSRVARSGLTTDQKITSQIKELHAFCDQKGWKVLETIEEVCSGSSFKNRLKFNAWLKQLATDHVETQILLVTTECRFSRNIKETIKMKLRLSKLGIKLHVLRNNQTFLEVITRGTNSNHLSDEIISKASH